MEKRSIKPLVLWFIIIAINQKRVEPTTTNTNECTLSAYVCESETATSEDDEHLELHENVQEEDVCAAKCCEHPKCDRFVYQKRLNECYLYEPSKRATVSNAESKLCERELVVKYEDYEFKIGSVKLNWTDAENECQKWNGHLATISSGLLEERISEKMKLNYMDFAWIGYYTKKKNGQDFQWIEPCRNGCYTNWASASGYPVDHGEESCALIYNSLWVNFPCRHTWNYICQRPIVAPTTTNTIAPTTTNTIAPTTTNTNVVEVKDCDSNPCHKHATCRNTIASYQCICDIGYMGNGLHCEAMWLENSRCGPVYRLSNGMQAQCNYKGNLPCCSPHGFCGNTPQHCECPMCIDYRQACLYNDMEILNETLKEIAAVSSWKHCESLCKEEKQCKAWEWKTQMFDEISQHKSCTLKQDGNKENLRMRFGVMSGLKYCGDDEKRAFKGISTQVSSCSYPGSCKGNICTRGNTGSVLQIGESLRSDSKRYLATMQHDGNFVIYCLKHEGTKAIWSSQTSGTYVYDGLIFQNDGNLVIYKEIGKSKEAVWSSGTFETGADHLILQNDGNLVLYGSYGRQIYWEAKSHGKC